MFSDYEQLDELVLSIPFPAGVKVRISITGLAFASLARDRSTINFLRHVPNHELRMTVVERNLRTATDRNLGTFILNAAPAAITVNPVNPVPTRIKDDIAMPSLPDLEKMINLRASHGGIIDPRSPAPATAPSTLTLTNCTFYTLNYFGRDCFELIDLGPSGNRIRNELGFILGASLRATRDAETTITFSSATGSLTQPLPGTSGGDELVYDIIFNNNCNNLPLCSADVVHTGGTDFALYYQVLQERADPSRTYILRKLRNCRGVLGKQILSDIAACNPVIIFPDPGGY